jgi:hypothetical protein
MTGEPVTMALGEIHSTQQGFSRLAALAAALDRYRLDIVKVNFAACTWFDANMSAPLGVVFAHALDKLNTLQLCGLQQSVETILAKNRFLAGFGFPEKVDTHGATIPYRRFSATDDRYFAAYLNRHLRGKELPIMSEALSQRFKNSILEIFVNAAMHSDSKLGIFACGQYFPRKNRLDFCVADAGLGIRRKIYRELGLKMNSDKAIDWALQEGNTTRKGSVPGGLGLKLIQEFIAMNEGRIQIVSDRGYWEFSPRGETLTRIDTSFPGTVINIEINTADTGSYGLRAE